MVRHKTEEKNVLLNDSNSDENIGLKSGKTVTLQVQHQFSYVQDTIRNFPISFFNGGRKHFSRFSFSLTER